MKNLWKKTDIKPMEVDTPVEIIQYQCTRLWEMTEGSIIAKVYEYSQPIFSYIEKSRLIRTIDENKKINIQENLGDVSDGTFSYEFFITSTSTPKFKYRIMFLQYDISVYPVTLVLDESILEELELNQELVTCNNQTEFEIILEKILNSKKVTNVISALLKISQRDKVSI